MTTTCTSEGCPSAPASDLSGGPYSGLCASCAIMKAVDMSVKAGIQLGRSMERAFPRNAQETRVFDGAADGGADVEREMIADFINTVAVAAARKAGEELARVLRSLASRIEAKEHHQPSNLILMAALRRQRDSH